MRTMKDSGIEWIGEIPESWRLSRLLWCMEEIKEKNNPIRTTNVLSLTNKLGVVPYEEKGNQGNKAKDDFTEYGLAFENTLVINSMNVLIGSVGISKYFGCVSPVYYVFKNTEYSELRFINYIFQTEQFQKELRNFANGILEIRLRISAHDMLRRLVPFPSLEEQQSIAAYLDAQCVHIDNVIEKTRASIEELKKIRLSVISQHTYQDEFMYIPLKRCITQIDHGLSPSPSDDSTGGNWKVLALSAVKNGRYIPDENKPICEELERCKRYKLELGDFLLTRANTRELVGQVCIVNEMSDEIIFSDLIFRIHFDESILISRYALFFLQSAFARQQIQRDAHGSNSTMVKITHKDIFNWYAKIPPISEQKEIAAYLDKKCAEIDALIAKKEQFLEELENYKKSMIYEYVTGKKEVPQNAAEN